MTPPAAMTTAELVALIPTLRNELSRANAAENLLLAQDLRRTLALASAELRTRRAPHAPQRLQA
jgi:hypothetical protein